MPTAEDDVYRPHTVYFITIAFSLHIDISHGEGLCWSFGKKTKEKLLKKNGLKLWSPIYEKMVLIVCKMP